MKHLIVLIPFLYLLACSSTKPAAQLKQNLQTPQNTARVEKKPAIVTIAGTIRAADVAELASRYGGFVQGVEVKAGSRVEAGQLLVILDDRSLQAQAGKASAAEQEILQAIEEAKQHGISAEAQYTLASNTFERIQALFDKGSASKQEWEESKTRLDSARAERDAAQGRLAQVRSRLTQAQSDFHEVNANLRYQRISAPFAGVVTSVIADLGTYVNPGQTIVTIENPSQFQLVFSVEQGLLPFLKPGAALNIRVPSLSEDSLPSIVTEVSPATDAVTQTFLVKANLPVAAGLQSGLTGEVDVVDGSASSLWIPAEFLNNSHDIETVMVRAGSDWRRVLVKSGTQNSGNIEILSGLREGEEIGRFEESI